MASILIVYQHYLEPNAPGFSRFNEYAPRWVRAGHAVTILSGQVNYQLGTRDEKYRGRWWTREAGPGGETIVRVFTSGDYSRSFVGRSWAHIGFAVAAIGAVPRLGHYDVVLVSSPPLTVALPGWAAALWQRAPILFEVRDLWPEAAVTTGVLKSNSVLASGLRKVEQLAYRWSRRINVVTPAYIDNIVGRHLAPRDKFVVIPNGVDTELFQPDAVARGRWRSVFGWGEKFVVLYAGAHGLANDLGQLLDVARELRHEPKILIATVGDGMYRKELETQARREGLSNFQLLGPYPKSDVPGILNAADACAAVLQENPTFRTVYPNKMFEYMAVEKPVLLVIDGVARELVEEARAGVYVPPRDARAFAEAVRKLTSDDVMATSMGRRGREFVKERFDRDVLATRMLDALLETARQRKSP